MMDVGGGAGACPRIHTTSKTMNNSTSGRVDSRKCENWSSVREVKVMHHLDINMELKS